MILSNASFDTSNMENILKLSLKNMRDIIKTETKMDRFLKKQARKWGIESID